MTGRQQTKEVVFKIEFNHQIMNAISEMDAVVKIRKHLDAIPFTIYRNNEPVLKVTKYYCSDCQILHEGMWKGECDCECHETTSKEKSSQ